MALFRPPFAANSGGDASTLGGKSETELSVYNSNKLNNKTEDQLSVASAVNATNATTAENATNANTLDNIDSSGFSLYNHNHDEDYARDSHNHDTLYVSKFRNVTLIISMSLTEPPEYSNVNDIYILGGQGTGAWSGFATGYVVKATLDESSNIVWDQVYMS